LSTSSQQTPRIFTRGEETQFRVEFFADVAKTTPLVPIDPSYPSYTIYDPTGIAIQTGTGTLVQAGEYRLNFLVPKDAPLSYFHQAPQRYGDEGQGAPLTANDARYRIEWQMVTNANRQVNLVEEFDIRDVAVTQSLNRELKYLVMAGRPFRPTYRTPVLPFKTEMSLFVRGNDQNPLICELLDFTAPLSGGQPTGNLKYAKDGDSYVLYFDVPAGTTQANTAYMILWTVQETEFSIPQTHFDITTSISVNVLPLMTSLRMLIDKFQKRLGRLQSYEDSDLLEYLAQGARTVNLSYPTTGYPLESMPDGLQSLVLLAAGWWGLKAQALLEADLSFNFSGQSVTLSVDRAGAIDSAASSMMEMFNGQIGPAKMAYVRNERGMGTVAGRAYSYRRMHNYVFRISSIGSDNLLQTLTKIGLL
jgi:hypothetical protein